MQNKPMLILTIVLVALVAGFFFLFGFSDDKWTRYGQYGGMGLCVLFILDGIFRP